MTSDDVGSHKSIDQEQRWQLLIELSLSRESGNACWVVDQVAEAMQPLNWPASHLERLKLALVKAMWNEMERSRQYESEAPLIIRVQIPENDEVTQEADQIDDELSQHQVSEKEEQKSSRGWGFFLVQKQGNDSRATPKESQHVIEVFLYQESDRAQKHR